MIQKMFCRPLVAFQIGTSHSICIANQINGFYMNVTRDLDNIFWVLTKCYDKMVNLNRFVLRLAMRWLRIASIWTFSMYTNWMKLHINDTVQQSNDTMNRLENHSTYQKLLKSMLKFFFYNSTYLLFLHRIYGFTDSGWKTSNEKIRDSFTKIIWITFDIIIDLKNYWNSAYITYLIAERTFPFIAERFFIRC